jgi:hypothetical protein
VNLEKPNNFQSEERLLMGRKLGQKIDFCNDRFSARVSFRNRKIRERTVEPLECHSAIC